MKGLEVASVKRKEENGGREQRDGMNLEKGVIALQPCAFSRKRRWRGMGCSIFELRIELFSMIQ